MPARRSHSAATRSARQLTVDGAVVVGQQHEVVLGAVALEEGVGVSHRAPGVVLRPVVVVELLDGHPGGLDLPGDHRPAGHQRFRVPGLGLPDPRAQERLGAVEEQVVDVHHHGQQRPVSLHHHLVEERRIADQPGTAVDAQGVAAAGDEEVQPDVGVLQDVAVAVGAAVARAFGERDGAVVDDVDQAAGRVALGRGVALTGAGRGRHHAERRGRQPGAVDVEQRGAGLGAGAFGGFAEQVDELVDGGDRGPVGLFHWCGGHPSSLGGQESRGRTTAYFPHMNSLLRATSTTPSSIRRGNSGARRRA